MMELDEFRCPKCKGKLDIETLPSLHKLSKISCINCEAIYPINKGIIDFRLRKDYYFGQLSREKMNSLIASMAHESWAETLRAFIGFAKNKRRCLDDLMTDGRYAWHTLLNLNHNTVLLDLGCGLGNLSKNFAQNVAKIYAIDLTYSNLEFSRHRFAQCNPNDNIILLAAGDGQYLPFPDSAIDCVVISEFSERVSALAEIKRILKPGGQLFMACKNRFNYEVFTGRLAPGSGQKHISTLPRFFANLYSQILITKAYLRDTYSIFAIRKLLKNTNFEKIDFFALSPNYNRLEEIFPVDANIPKWRPSKPSRMKARIKRNKYFVPEFGILANVSKAAQSSLQERLFAQIEHAIAEHFKGASLYITEYFVTGKDKGVMKGFIGKQAIVIKLPFNKTSFASERQNAAMLLHVNGHYESELSFCPRNLLQGSIQNQPYFVEEVVNGLELQFVAVKEGRTSCLNSVARILEQLNPQTKTQMQCLVDHFYKKEVADRLEILFQVLEDRGVQQAIASYFHDNLYGIIFSCGIRHGDYGVYNILVQNNEVSGLIDWEKASSKGILLFDVFDYLNSIHRLFNPGISIARTLSILASGEWPIPKEQEFLSQQFSRWGTDFSRLQALVSLYWLHTVTHRLDYRLIEDEPKLRKNINGLINIVSKKRAQLAFS